MSLFWSLFIAIITLISLAGCAALLYWTSQEIKGVPDDAQIGHDIDGIQEFNAPLPKWWSYLFWASLVFAIFYLLAYGLGGFAGWFGWKSAEQNVKNRLDSDSQFDSPGLNQYARELAAANQRFDSVVRGLLYQPGSDQRLTLEQIANNPAARQVGRRLYLQNCSQCHGINARGGIGFPNLTDHDWLYGGTPQDIKHSLVYGRNGVMAPLIAVLGEQGVQEVVSYTLSLSGRKVNPLEAEKGKPLFAICAACHGSDGKGNILLGAPNLTDNIWLYGGSRSSLVETVTYGRQAVMPAWLTILGEDKIDLLTAYVWSLSNKVNN